MGVCEETPKVTGMHWQQHERYVGPAYDPSRDLSPNLPVHSSDSSSMGDGDGGTSGSSNSSSTTSSSTGSTTCSHSATSVDCSNNNTSTSVCGGINPGGGNPGSGGGVLLGPSSSCCRVVGSTSNCTTTSGNTTFTDYPTSPPASSCKLEEQTGSSVMCAGCGGRIADRYFLQAIDRRWHASCLQCSQCRQTLDGEGTCFYREGNIYCKKDYYRLFGYRRCGRCQAAISASELVMRARELVFHIQCFTCTVCNAVLTKGDHFGMHGPNVFCQHHYKIAAASGAIRSSPPCTPTCPPLPVGYHPYHTPPFPSPNEYHQIPPSSNPNTMPPQPPPNPSPCGLDPTSGKVFFNGAPAARQKGRPRKRKPKDLESMTANLDLNADSYLDVSYGRGAGPSPGGGMSGSNGQSQRTKRMRTSFKHHQLRTMKSYFAINHNPDAKDLKQLSQKTGLPKRVLQVWFQNARAKWRRMIIKQEGKLPSEKGVGSPSDLQHLHQAGDYHGGMHLQGPDASCSPHYMMASPPSLECS